MENKILEKRMYFFVPYNISDIQKGIQCGHAALRYARNNSMNSDELWDFVDNHETWIILNGGTTNNDYDDDNMPKGTLNQIAAELLESDINFSYFNEPDLNEALTSICFICDERVFNYKNYPDFINYLIKEKNMDSPTSIQHKMMNEDELINKYGSEFDEWVNLLGGLKNIILRDIIKYKKLA